MDKNKKKSELPKTQGWGVMSWSPLTAQALISRLRNKFQLHDFMPSPWSWMAWYNSTRNRDLLYISQGIEPKTPVTDICLKYQIMTPRSFVSGINFRFIEGNGEFRNHPDPREKLGLELRVIDSTDERITYLEAIIDRCEHELFDQPLNEQFEHLLNAAKSELNRISGKKITTKKEKNELPKITKIDIIFRFLELKDKGSLVASAVDKTRQWLIDNDIDPDNTKELFGITISNESPDSFRKLADNYYSDYLKQKRNNPE